MALEGERHVPLVRRYNAAMHLGHTAAYREALRYSFGRRILDVGCGTGYGSFFLAYYSANHVEAVDNFAPALEYARQVYLHPRLNFEEGDALALPYPDSSFDFVFSSQVIEHVPSSRQFLKEIYRVLRDDGFCLITTPNRRLFSPGDVDSNPYHINEMSLNEYLAVGQELFPRVVVRGIPQRCLEMVAGNPIPQLKPDARIDPLAYQVQDDGLEHCENLLMYAHKDPQGIFSSTLPHGLLAACLETAPIFFDPQVGLHVCMGTFPDRSIQPRIVPLDRTGQLFSFKSPLPMLYRLDMDLAEPAKVAFSIEITTNSGKRLATCDYSVGQQYISLVFDAVRKAKDELFYLFIKPLSQDVGLGTDSNAILISMVPAGVPGRHKQADVPVLSTFHQVLPHGS